MVQLYLRLTVAPAHVHETIQTLRAIMALARQRGDCAGARLCADVENPTVLNYAEHWLTSDALNRELQASRFGRLLEVMETSVDPATLEFRFVSDVRGLDYVEAQRATRDCLLLAERHS
jgi:hypothetical protein